MLTALALLDVFNAAKVTIFKDPWFLRIQRDGLSVIKKHIPSRVWDEITFPFHYPFPNCTVEVFE